MAQQFQIFHRPRNAEAMEAIKRESAILSKLQHPNIVQLVAISETPEGQPIMIMDLLDDDLKRVCYLFQIYNSKKSEIVPSRIYLRYYIKVLQNRQNERMKNVRDWFPEKEIIIWCLQIAKGLEYLHSNGIAHRDLKVYLA